MLSIQAKEHKFSFITFKCFTLLLDHCSTVGVSHNWPSFSHFPKETNKWSVEKIVVGQFLLFHPSWSFVTTLTIALPVLVVQFGRRAWLKTELFYKYFICGLHNAKKGMMVFQTLSRFIWKFQVQLGPNESSIDLTWSDALIETPHKGIDICWLINQSNVYPST